MTEDAARHRPLHIPFDPEAANLMFSPAYGSAPRAGSRWSGVTFRLASQTLFLKGCAL